MNEKEKYIIEYLKINKKFVISSELIEALEKKFPDITNANARKIISNLSKKKEISSSSPITFSNNNYAYAYKNKKANYNNLKELVKKHKKKLYRAICLIKRQKGLITYSEFAKVTGGVTSESEKNVEIVDIIKELKYFEIASVQVYKGITFIIGQNNIDVELEEKILELQKENKILINLINWLKDVNIINIQDLVTFKGEKNNFKGIENGNIIWDAFFFTNTVGIENRNTKTKTVGIIDFSFKSTYDVIDVEGLRDRLNIFINSTKETKRKVFPIIFFDKITNAARKIIKENNYMCVDIKKILGDNYDRIISRYIEVENKKEIDIMEIDKICNLIGSNANYGNMKGNLFEYMMGEVFRKIYTESGTNFEHSIMVNGKEIDYRIETKNENIFIELKAYRKDVEINLGEQKEKNTINWSYKTSFKAFQDNFKGDKNRKCKFCYITTAKFEKKALDTLEKFNSGKCRAEKLECYYDRNKLCNLLKEYKCKKEIKIIENYY